MEQDLGLTHDIPTNPDVGGLLLDTSTIKPTKPKWTPERVEQLRGWWEKHSASQIAKFFGEGMSRSAVISAVHRYNIDPGKKIILSGTKSFAKLKRLKEKIAKLEARIPAELLAPELTEPEPIKTSKPRKRRVSTKVSTVKRFYPGFTLQGGCRYIPGDDLKVQCDCPRVDMTPYCDHHLELVIRAD